MVTYYRRCPSISKVLAEASGKRTINPRDAIAPCLNIWTGSLVGGQFQVVNCGIEITFNDFSNNKLQPMMFCSPVQARESNYIANFSSVVVCRLVIVEKGGHHHNRFQYWPNLIISSPTSSSCERMCDCLYYSFATAIPPGQCVVGANEWGLLAWMDGRHPSFDWILPSRQCKNVMMKWAKSPQVSKALDGNLSASSSFWLPLVTPHFSIIHRDVDAPSRTKKGNFQLVLVSFKR